MFRNSGLHHGRAERRKMALAPKISHLLVLLPGTVFRRGSGQGGWWSLADEKAECMDAEEGLPSMRALKKPVHGLAGLLWEENPAVQRGPKDSHNTRISLSSWLVCTALPNIFLLLCTCPSMMLLSVSLLLAPGEKAELRSEPFTVGWFCVCVFLLSFPQHQCNLTVMTFSAQLLNSYHWGLAKCRGCCGSGSKQCRFCHCSQGSLARRLGGSCDDGGLRWAFSDSDLSCSVLAALLAHLAEKHIPPSTYQPCSALCPVEAQSHSSWLTEI